MYESVFTKKEKAIIDQSAAIIKSKIKTIDAFSSSELVFDYCQRWLVSNEREVFSVLLLDSQNRLIESVELFYGTTNAASVYPRELVKLVLEYNSSRVILVHNHPSGDITPSDADVQITKRIVKVLELIDVDVLDHIIIGTDGAVSLAKKNLM